MVEPNVLELLNHADSRYTLVVEASKRGRQLVAGAQPLTDTAGMKPLGIAVEEIDRGLVTYEKNKEALEEDDLRGVK
ncbi:MAG: DNA-directed RNA polymerase subunit omega [Clostridia bacterium]|nr:DNA-directed RNA polymerase subunit omega [Clostridia bacterium]